MIPDKLFVVFQVNLHTDKWEVMKTTTDEHTAKRAAAGADATPKSGGVTIKTYELSP